MIKFVLKAVYLSVIVSLLSCSSFTTKPLPVSTAKVENTEISFQTKIFTYHWGPNHEYGDTDALSVNFEPVKVPPHSKITLSFSPKPKKYGTFYEVVPKEVEKKVENVEDGILIPYTEGIHTYVYNASWSEGGAVFVFKVEVVNEK